MGLVGYLGVLTLVGCRAQSTTNAADSPIVTPSLEPSRTLPVASLAASKTPPDSTRVSSTGDAARDTQILHVIESMDATQKPPAGVAQGGNPSGAFRNREGKLPGGTTYVESDIWPTSAHHSRGTERLIFGAHHEVWVTLDHYETFTRIR